MISNAQCGNFMIFISLRFYVKSIFEYSRSAKTAFFAILGAVNFVNLVNISLLILKKFMKRMADFALLEYPKIDFT